MNLNPKIMNDCLCKTCSCPIIIENYIDSMKKNSLGVNYYMYCSNKKCDNHKRKRVPEIMVPFINIWFLKQ